MVQNLKYHFPIFLLLFVSSLMNAQNSSNPFEIVPRLDPVIQKAIEKKKATGAPNNPFDIVRSGTVVRRTAASTKTVTPIAKVEEVKQSAPVLLGEDKSYRRFLFITILVMMIVLTFIFTLLRSIIGKAWQGFLNANILNQLFREWSLVTYIPYLILYGLFILNAGIFTLLLTKYFNIPVANSHIGSLLLCSGGIASFFLMRHALLNLTGYVFPVEKETGTYSFSLTILNIIIGLLLVPMILFIAYSPESLAKILIPIFLIILLGMYLYLLLRGLLIANRYVLLHKFHFLLYICAVEVTPLIIVVKWLISGGMV
ncbi:MAG: hypothetical protein ACI9XO_002060 [Paraglaciecola sp.]|jgi:hypothetical protein